MVHRLSLLAEGPVLSSRSLKEATVALGLLTPEEFDQKVRPERKCCSYTAVVGKLIDLLLPKQSCCIPMSRRYPSQKQKKVYKDTMYMICGAYPGYAGPTACG